jgi:hypothetical protein
MQGAMSASDAMSVRSLRVPNPRRENLVVEVVEVVVCHNIRSW